MGASRANHQWLRRTARAAVLVSLIPLVSCKHRRGPFVPEEWETTGLDASTDRLDKLIRQSQSLRVLELFEDGFVISDTLTYRLDLASSQLEVERRFDPVSFTPEEPIVVQQSSTLPAPAQAEVLQRLAAASVRQVPPCNPFGAVDGGYGGRFLILVDRSGTEHRFGASDAECAATDHDCSGSCVSQDTMNQLITALSTRLPIPEKPRTTFSCAVDSPLPCNQTEFTVYGEWEGTALRPDIRRTLAQRFCYLSAFSLEAEPTGEWRVQNSTRETVGTVRFNTQNRSVSCLTRVP